MLHLKLTIPSCVLKVKAFHYSMKSIKQIFLAFLICLITLSTTLHSAAVAGDEATEIKLQDLLVQQHLELCTYVADNQLAQAICGALCNAMKHDDVAQQAHKESIAIMTPMKNEEIENHLNSGIKNRSYSENVRRIVSYLQIILARLTRWYSTNTTYIYKIYIVYHG
ncbi:hypothetical protein FF38_11322 [Lucilia cuprina]|uniref:Uncharacterized protein n=1 Tax=Lucilia cuprina TaxID=7375 RepID=A0A0L0BVF3_LUCCU|nr:hypothetical protein FF38_11322 [Lucilia cuprina]